MNPGTLFATLFFLMVLQVIGTHLQVREYRKAVHRLHAQGNIGIGSKRRRFGPGNIVIIACRSDGAITGAEIMEGISIFCRFKPVQGVVGKSIYELKAEYLSLSKKRQKYYRGHLQALDALELRLQTKLLSSDTEVQGQSSKSAEEICV